MGLALLGLGACQAAATDQTPPPPLGMPLDELSFAMGDQYIRCAALHAYLFEVAVQVDGDTDTAERHFSLAESFLALGAFRRTFQVGNPAQEIRDKKHLDQTEAERLALTKAYALYASSEQRLGRDPGREGGVIYRDFQDCTAFSRALPKETGEVLD